MPKFSSEEIKGCTEVLYSVSSDSGYLQRDWLHVRDAIRRSSLCIHLAYDCIWLTFQEQALFPLQIRNMMVGPFDFDADRSEEHTSELQSLRHLVCRLLL